MIENTYNDVLLYINFKYSDLILGKLKLATVGVFTSGELANAASQVLIYCFADCLDISK